MRLLIALLIALAAPTRAWSEVLVQTDATFDALSAEVKAQMLSDPAAAVRGAERARTYALQLAAGPKRELMLATASWLIGEAATRTGQNDRARPLIEQAAEQATRVAPDSKLLADALLSRGRLRAADGDVARAMSDLHAAHDIFRKLGESRGRARAFVEIANLYCTANDWTAALKYYREALDVYHADPGLAVAILNGEGVALLSSGERVAALAAFRRSLALAREMKSVSLTATVLKNLAWALLEDGQVRPATVAIREGIAMTRGSAPPQFARRQLVVLARALYQGGDTVQAGALVDKAFTGVDLSKTELADRDSHQVAYEIDRALGRDDVALAHLTALKRLDDEATELARSNGAALMAARFDFANQELRIAKLKADDLRRSVAFERARARSQRIVLLAGVAATLLIIAVLAYALVAVRRSRDRVRAANVDLASTNAALGKALAAKTEFLATTSHEIRTPLNGILGMTQVMLADPKTDAATRDRVSVVHGAGVTMRALVDDILDVAKMETGNLTVEERAFDLRGVLGEATRMWAEQAQAKGLAFHVELDDCPALILGDPARLRQIVFNLLSNALKFTLAGSVVLRATRRGERYEIAVEDTGVGVAPARHEEIFESFRQADTTTTRQFGGTGLGLTICRNLARAMGGDVTVVSEEGAGATFLLSLPLRVADGEQAVGVPPPSDSIGVLVVDPNPISRAKMKALLDGPAGPAQAVADLSAAEALLGTRRCERVVVDDAALGDETAAAGLRRLVERSAVVVLRRADGADRAALLAAGARVLDRPIARDALIAAVCDEAVSTAVVTQAA